MKKILSEILLIIFTIIMLLILAGKLPINDNGTFVISFFGILATFVVIGNYSQVRDIKQDINENIRNFKKEITEKVDNVFKKTIDESDKTSIISQHQQMLSSLYDERGKSKITSLINSIQKLETHNAYLLKQAKLQNIKNENLSIVLSSLLNSEIRNHIYLIENLCKHGRYDCKLKCEGQDNSIDGEVVWNDDEGITFFCNNQRIYDVIRISNKAFNKPALDAAVRGLKSFLS